MACYVPGHLPHLHAGEQEKQLQAAAGMCRPAAWQSQMVLVLRSWTAKADRGPTA